MSVIVELEVAAREFELGRILQISQDVRIEMETVVPAGQRAVPLFWVYKEHIDSFEAAIGDHPTVDDITAVDIFPDRALYAIDWESGEKLWRFDMAFTSRPREWRIPSDAAGRSGPTVVGETLFVGSDDGVCYAIDTRSGEEK